MSVATTCEHAGVDLQPGQRVAMDTRLVLQHWMIVAVGNSLDERCNYM